MSCSEIPFKIEVPFEAFWKAGEEGKERRIAGIISTEHRDQQDEIVLQRGLDFGPFLKHGWLNDNHSKETDGVIGYPIKVEPVVYRGKPATRMEGYLIPGYGPADRIWKLAQALQKTDRRLGFSLEGGTRRRAGNDRKTIAEAVVRNVAITNCPVNTMTGLEVLAKSIAHMESGEPCEGCKRCTCVHKALSAGQAISAPGAATPGDGFALRAESLEGKRKRKRKKKNTLTKSEAVDLFLSRFPGASRKLADLVVSRSQNRRNP